MAGQTVLLRTCPSTISPLGTVFVTLFLTALGTVFVTLVLTALGTVFVTLFLTALGTVFVTLFLTALGTVFVTLFLTAVHTAICGVHMQICTGSVPTSLTLLFWRWLTVSSVFRVWVQAWAIHRNPLLPSPSLSPAVSNEPYVASVLFGSGTEKQNHNERKQFVT